MPQSPPLELRTDRLRLVAGSVGMFEAELAGPEHLKAMLEVHVPENWPPDLNDKTWTSFEVSRMRGVDQDRGWWNWYIILDHRDEAELIGDCGFRGRPDEQGEVEISYAILPDFRQQGYATEAAAALTDWALADEQVRCVVADTFEGMTASQRVLEKIGYHHEGEGSDPGSLRYRITETHRESARQHRIPS